ncbi:MULTISPECIES: hypothetical protein [Rhizobium]|uniref:DUF4129 domain-containing protein n=1 Tax=Rhizobium tropici TaxID=398 RepID=A0A6P1C609_RHITR|nr:MULTISPECIES: hypothetical protein [Rhizobium]AGB74200.1 hypothetical protein RTCIAT899_PC01985 [Rhizobium tropici CIAT 899]MBB4240685.1 hypothetical protein [Rhizobium tropici]MBB5591898.1 hypothetical protein [Rhizobium tropici]MBB6490952.1 hypothetical protein [Rhizobium tropici]NEV12610.1 hypothetical protein [Rhizobium tropici]
MAIRSLGLVAALFLAAAAQLQPAQAQDNVQLAGPAGEEYAAQCLLNGLRCKLTYSDSSEAAKSASSTTASQREPLYIPREPIMSGPLSVVVVLVALVAAIGLWMRFGNGGILLSQAPRELKQRREEAPESWRTSIGDIEERPGDFLQRIAAMADRKQALVLLLRHCLLHAADVTGTRLFRSDTERAVLARLPENMPDRDHLENLLTETELVHYGGRVLAEGHFAALLATARGLLSGGKLRNA